ncbi:MAG: two-component system, NtrC family, response regulator AtoC [Verrucomicrobiota bacterium]|jgi:DNA-binding NtrC family response regulator
MFIEKILSSVEPVTGAGLLGASPVMARLHQLIRKVARTQATLLIRGEFGTGKRLVAEALQLQSPRAEQPFFRLDCAACTGGALEHQLFGREPIADSDAADLHPGLLERARGGTLLLEEVGELSPAVQARLLRLLQDGTFERSGRRGSLQSDVRILATTNRDLEGKVQRAEFREDLFLRLNIVPVLVPPLRERHEDIVILANHFRTACAQRQGIDAPPFSPASWSALEAHTWPGNVRELQQRIELAMVTSTAGSVIEPAHLGFASTPGSRVVVTDKDFVEPLTEMEKRHIFAVLERCKWNRGNAADRLGISIRTLRNKLKEYKGDAEECESNAVSARQP